MSLAPGATLGPYRIIGPVGAGGMGEVYRATDTRIGRDVAVKVLPPELLADESRLRRFDVEARAVGALNHPNLLVLFDVGIEQGAPYVVTELLEGETLRERLLAGPLPVRKACEIAAQAARGLGAAHEKGIVHRDLKPENLYLTSDGRVKILDFGLAKVAESARAGSGADPTMAALSDVGQVLGTAGYMAPEQIHGGSIDPPADLFSLGAVLYEMVSGRRAFRGDSTVDTMHAILHRDPPELASTSVPPALDRIIRRCLEKRPGERFRSAFDLAFALDSISMSGSSASFDRVPHPGAKRKRLWLGLALAAAGAILVAAGAAAVKWMDQPATDPVKITRLSFRRMGLWTARFSPDGQSVLFGATYQQQVPELFVSRIGSTEARSLGVQDVDLFAVSRQGDLALKLNASATGPRNGMLAQMAIDGGSPRELLKDVSAAEWSPDGRDLAVIVWAGGKRRLEFPIGTVLAEEAGPGGGLVRFSPGGDRLAVGWRRDNVPTTLVFDTRGKTPPVVIRKGINTGLCWIGSDELLFSVQVDGGTEVRSVTSKGRDRWHMTLPGNFVLHDCRADGALLVEHIIENHEVALVGSDQTGQRDLSWLDTSEIADLSSDGHLLLISAEVQPVASYIRKTDGSPAKRLGDGRPLALSPDGEWALTRSGSPPENVLLPTGPGQPKRFPAVQLTLAVPFGARSWWSADSRQFGFTASEPGRPPRCWVQATDGGEPKPVTPEGVARCWLPSPDGRHLFANDNDLVDLKSGSLRRVPGIPAGDEPLRWTSDGRFVFTLHRTAVSSGRIDRVEVSTGRHEFVRDIETSGPIGSGSLPQVQISADGRTVVYGTWRYFSDLLLIQGMR